MIAAVTHLAAQTGARLTRISSPPPAAAGRLEQSLEVTWHAFSGPLFYAALELWVVTRQLEETDAFAAALHAGHILPEDF